MSIGSWIQEQKNKVTVRQQKAQADISTYKANIKENLRQNRENKAERLRSENKELLAKAKERKQLSSLKDENRKLKKDEFLSKIGLEGKSFGGPKSAKKVRSMGFGSPFGGGLGGSNSPFSQKNLRNDTFGRSPFANTVGKSPFAPSSNPFKLGPETKSAVKKKKSGQTIVIKVQK